MDATVLETRAGRWAAWVNLLLPGGGLILLGAVGSGLLAGLLFIACANFALVAVLWFPDDFSGTTQALGIGLAAGAYVGAQVRVMAQVRRLRAEGTAARRRRRCGRRGTVWRGAKRLGRSRPCVRWSKRTRRTCSSAISGPRRSRPRGR